MKRRLFLIVFILLLSAGCTKLEEASKKGTFIQATKEGNLTLVQNLLNEGISPNTRDYDGVPVLMWASEEGHIDIVKLLLDKGANVNGKRTKDGTTVLMETSEEGHADVVKILLDRGAKVNVKRRTDGITALMEASDKCRTDVVKLLLDKGAKVNVKRAKDGTTALIEAADEGCTDVAKLLLDKGADVNARKTKDGATALIEASEGGHTEIVKLLLDRGADMDAKRIINNLEFTALMMAKMERHSDIVEILEKAGAGDVGEIMNSQYDRIALSNIKVLTTAQEAYYIMEATFCDSMKELIDISELDGVDVEISPGVTATIDKGDDDGYVMKAFHEKGDKIYMSRFSFSEDIDDNGNPEISEIEGEKVKVLRGAMR